MEGCTENLGSITALQTKGLRRNDVQSELLKLV